MNYKVIGSVLLVLILIVGVVWAGEAFAVGDKTKEFNKVPKLDTSNYIKEKAAYGVIILNDTKVGKLSEYTVTEKYEDIIDIGMFGRVTLYRDSVLFDDPMFINMTGETNITKSGYAVLTLVDNYVSVPDTVKTTCHQITNENTSKKEPVCEDVWTYKDINDKKWEWVAYNGEVLKAGDYEWRFDGKRKPGQIVDMIPTNYGLNFSEWLWYNSSWVSYREINISERSNAQNWLNYSVYMNITWVPGMQADFDDLRFTNVEGNIIKPHFVESKVNSASAMVWVKTNLTKNSNNSIYMYYGNSAAINSSNRSQAFIWDDDGLTNRSNQYTYAGAGAATTKLQWNPTTFYGFRSGQTGTYDGIMYPTSVGNNSYGNVSVSITEYDSGIFYSTGMAVRAGSAAPWDNHYRLQKVNANLDARIISTSQGAAGTATNGVNFNATIFAYGSTINWTGCGATCGSRQATSTSFTIGIPGAVFNYAEGTTFFKYLRIREFAGPITEPTTVVGPEVNNSVAPLTACNPTINVDWVITDSQVCNGVNANVGTGSIRITGVGNLYIINGANVTAKNLTILRTGDAVVISSKSELRLA
jgi:hypothetical protein